MANLIQSVAKKRKGAGALLHMLLGGQHNTYWWTHTHTHPSTVTYAVLFKIRPASGTHRLTGIKFVVLLEIQGEKKHSSRLLTQKLHYKFITDHHSKHHSQTSHKRFLRVSSALHPSSLKSVTGLWYSPHTTHKLRHHTQTSSVPLHLKIHMYSKSFTVLT